MGITKERREIVVRDDGSVEVAASQTVEVHIEGFSTFGTSESWVVPVVESTVKLDFDVKPPDPSNLPRPDTKVSLAEIDGKPVREGKLAWSIEFPRPLPVGAECTWNLSYETKPDAFQKEYYIVSVGLPMREVELIVRPKNETVRRFFEGQCVFEGMSRNRDYLRQLEESRIQLKPYRGGYKASVKLPLVGSLLRLSWQTKETVTAAEGPSLKPEAP
jgi:hypothetical protein